MWCIEDRRGRLQTSLAVHEEETKQGQPFGQAV